MAKDFYSVISGSGKYIPENVVPNKSFHENVFYDEAGIKIEKSGEEISKKFQQITDIEERRHVGKEHNTSDIAFFAAENALISSNTDKEKLDYIIVAHNFGDVRADNKRSDFVPTLASRVKYKLGIKNPYTVAYDLPFGCPGWLQGVIQANYYIKSGDAKKILVIGSEVLSRVSDPHDRDSMLYSDGAGAVILDAVESEEPIGILAHNTRTDIFEFEQMLRMDYSYNKDFEEKELFLKMNGRKLYEYALKTVPLAIKNCLDKTPYKITDIKKVLIHQANGKMDDAILKRLFALYNLKDFPKEIMPMTISWLGNSSVATLPTLYDLISKNDFEGHELQKGDLIIFASVGAGMNINSVVYKVA